MAHYDHRIPRRLLLAALMMGLAGCATTDFASRRPELVVEGDGDHHRFEAAAKGCSYTAYWRFPGVKIQGDLSLGSHFNLFQTHTHAARCALGWIENHPESGLYVSIY